MTDQPSPLSLIDRWGTHHHIDAVLFDKDGTLLDFHASWDAAVGGVLDRLTGDDHHARAEAARVLRYDLTDRRVLPDSPIIAESNEHIIELVRPIVGHLVVGDLTDRFNQLIAEIGTTMVAAAPGAAELIDFLQTKNVPMAVATNDAEAVATAQLEHLGWAALFSAVVGYDSGYGAKPEPGMIAGAAQRLGVDPVRCLMIGVSPHDLLAATAAGAVPVLVGNNPSAVEHAAVHFDGLPELQGALAAL